MLKRASQHNTAEDGHSPLSISKGRPNSEERALRALTSPLFLVFPTAIFRKALQKKISRLANLTQSERHKLFLVKLQNKLFDYSLKILSDICSLFKELLN